MPPTRTVLFLFSAISLLTSCSVSKQLQTSAQTILLNDSSLQTAHIGISIYEPATGKWWYNYQGDKYFVPASNVKIATCYAAMKYLGDSLVAAKTVVDEQGRLRVFPSGDPTFLHPEFRFQPLFLVMKQHKTILWSLDGWQEERWGSGWSWNDYDAAYMAERSPLPVYGNVAGFQMKQNILQTFPPKLSIDADAALGYDKNTSALTTKSFRVAREIDNDTFYLKPATALFTRAHLPLRMDARLVSALLEDTLKAGVTYSTTSTGYVYRPGTKTIHSQPTDSLLKPLMHRSDNFFAEQALLMVSNEVLGFMNDEKIIDTLLKTDLKDLPQKPRWADGSGLSRYNLFTPQDLVMILQKMKTAFGMNRIRNIMATGNEGTLANYYKADSSFIHAKTGTLSGVVALSGFLTTVKGRDLIFSVLVNNHQSGATQVRRAVEKFIQNLRRLY